MPLMRAPGPCGWHSILTLRNVLPEPPWTWQQWSIALGSLLIALALLTWLGRIIWQQTHRPAPPIPPEVQARDALRPLQDEQWLAPEKLKEYHYRLSEVVRTYVEQQFGVAAPDMTTEEFLREVRGEWDGAAKKHADWLIGEHPEEDPQRIRNLLAEVALEAANDEREDADRLTEEINQLQERLYRLRRERNGASHNARTYQAAHDELIG